MYVSQLCLEAFCGDTQCDGKTTTTAHVRQQHLTARKISRERAGALRSPSSCLASSMYNFGPPPNHKLTKSPNVKHTVRDKKSFWSEQLLLLKLLLWFVCLLLVRGLLWFLSRVGGVVVGSQELHRDPLPPDPPPRTAQNFALFFPSPATNFAPHCVFSVEFSWFCEDRDPQMCTSEVLGMWGFTRQPENSKRAHLRAPASSKHHQKTTRRHTVRDKKSKTGGGRRKESAKFWAPHPSGPNFFWVWAPHFGAMTHTRSRNGLAKNGLAKNWPKLAGPKPRWPKMDWLKLVLAKIGQKDGQNGIGQSRSLPH